MRMKFPTAQLLLCTQLTSARAVSTTNDIRASGPQTYGSVPLDFGKEYTHTELVELVHQYGRDISSEEEALEASDELSHESMSEENLVGRSINLQARSAIKIHGKCDLRQEFNATFLLKAAYDGYKVHWTNLCGMCRPVDSWGYIGIAGGNGKAITSDAEIRRRSCWFTWPDKMCSYHVHNTIRATVDGGIKITSFQPKDTQEKTRPSVIETCIVTNDRHQCPPPTGPTCQLGPVDARPLAPL